MANVFKPIIKAGIVRAGIVSSRIFKPIWDTLSIWRNSFVAAYPALTDVQNVATEGTIMNLMPKGQGTATSTHAAPILFPDADGVYRSADVDEPAWNGARVDLDPDKLFWSGLGVTATTPTPIANMRAGFSDGSTHREKYSDGYIGDSVAAGVNATYRPADGESVDIYLGSNVNLTQFFCYSNQLTGSIPNLSSSVNLTHFNCYSNQLTGSIPDLSNNVNLTRFYCYSNQLTGSIPDLSSNVNLVTFFCSDNQLTGSIPDLSSNVNLIYFYCYSNQLTGSIPDLSSNVNLTEFFCLSNQLTGSIPDLSNNVKLNQFFCFHNGLTGYLGGWPAKAFNFNASDNALTEAAVNLILTEADTYGIATGTTIDLSGGTNAVPTGAGLTAKANLIANGATVTTN